MGTRAERPDDIPDDLAAAVDVWLDGDPDPADRAELTALVEAGDTEALAARFAGPLTFGTAGLRGPLRAGPAGMNTAVVRRAAAGLTAWLIRRSAVPATTQPPTALTVVVGYDARHRSERFALDSAAVFAAAGLRALVLPAPLPTPVLAFAVRHLDAAAGVMVTASHNPATDNGYKVYLGGPSDDPGCGAQIVAPTDTEIEREIVAVGPARTIPLADGWQRLDAGIVAVYIEGAVRAVAHIASDGAPSDDTGADGVRWPGGTGSRNADDLVIAYTPLHGVGGDLIEAAFARAGLPIPVSVAEQRMPDPDFPTVPFPNPEEPGVLDAVLALGERIGADLVLVNDPDGDRCAAAVGQRVLTGDETGILLADQVLRGCPGPVATTVVSSEALASLAASAGVRCVQTLTGFKWIMRADPDLVFGYEEALGYAVAPRLVRDKDGITAALALARVAAAQKRRGRTLLDALDDVQRRVGAFATGQRSVRVDDLGMIRTVMSRLRESPPERIGDWPVVGIRDLLAGDDIRPGDDIRLPSSDVLIMNLSDGARVVARPSGTEPKLKFYLQVVARPTPGEAFADVRVRADADLARLRAAVDELIANGS